MVFIKSLTLWQFRNYATLHWEGLGQRNIITGANGAGKSNLLEAIYLLAHGKSNRATRDAELVRRWVGQHPDEDESELPTDHLHELDPYLGQGTRVALELEGGGSLEIRLLPQGGQRSIRAQFYKHGKRCASRSEIVGTLPCVSFYLSDLDIVRGQPQHRRRWLDMACVQRLPHHLRYLQQWKHHLNEKNALLRQATFPHPRAEALTLLDILNTQLASLAYEIILNRQNQLSLLEAHLPSIYSTLSNEQDGIPALRYHVFGWKEMPPPHETPHDVWVAACMEHLQKLASLEIRRQSAQWGIHRDDVGIRFLQPRGQAPVDVHTYASQGQQRSIVIALKLAELATLKEAQNNAPLILLDDVMAELDAERQAHLLDVFPTESQVFLTTPHLDAIAHIHDAGFQNINTCYWNATGNGTLTAC
jgi:DNA replication and repair protein RecF